MWQYRKKENHQAHYYPARCGHSECEKRRARPLHSKGASTWLCIPMRTLLHYDCCALIYSANSKYFIYCGKQRRKGVQDGAKETGVYRCPVRARTVLWQHQWARPNGNPLGTAPPLRGVINVAAHSGAEIKPSLSHPNVEEVTKESNASLSQK